MDDNKNILLIEDDIDINEAVTYILQEEGYIVISTFNGQEALEYLRDSNQKPALIILDIMMPIMNGYEFREAQLKDPKISSIPTILLSASGKYEDFSQMNFSECLKKPLDLERLIEVINRHFSFKT
jgi:CheY-like chemotaxis protein